jgi:hypothetical protein
VKPPRASGVINGKPGNVYDPKGSATRAEVATIFARYVEIYVEHAIDVASVDVHLNGDSKLSADKPNAAVTAV